ncbi:MAG: OmpA family protein [Myxococcota bacterium]
MNQPDGDAEAPRPTGPVLVPTAQDADGDGVPNDADACPALPESRDGVADDDGCPERGNVVRVGFALRFHDAKVRFEIDTYELHRDALPLMDALAAALEAHPEIRLLDIEGHRSWTRYEPIVELSLERARAVREALVRRGIAPERLRAAGYAAWCPLDPRRNEAAYARNRRIEMKISATWDGPTGVELGCAEGAELRPNF